MKDRSRLDIGRDEYCRHADAQRVEQEAIFTRRATGIWRDRRRGGSMIEKSAMLVVNHDHQDAWPEGTTANSLVDRGDQVFAEADIARRMLVVGRVSIVVADYFRLDE